MTPRREYTAADAFDAGQFVPMDGTRDDWVRALAAGRDAGLTDDELIGLSACAPNYGGERATRAALRSIKPGAVKAGTWFFLARQAGWKPRKDGEPPRAARPAPVVPRPVEPVRPTHESLSEYGRRIWSESRPPAGTIGAEYLLARRCVIPPADGDLRFHPALPYPKLGDTPEERAAQPDYCGPALVALVTDIVTGEPIGLHRTWICADGTKPVNLPGPARLTLGGHRKQGGCIRLWPDEAVTTGLGIGEGIESCLSLAHGFAPVWSLIDAGNLKALPVLPGIEALVIAADHDPAGIAAAQECATRWAAAGCRVSLLMAPAVGADLNDVLKAAA
ncbi:toprim domain-containing protein [Sphaerotilus sp.]|uniref:DUF7146 domain-containing protein n=1 Tax=Sphaerotilus sp. TaxID=2093942 RepID=UPI00286E70DD|nr:toprim domain-containing protein [Sphaerotilus sp.]